MENNGWDTTDRKAKRINPLEKYSFIIGTKINKWQVKGLYKDKKTYASCICDCGTERGVLVGNLINGRSKDCGCGRKMSLSKMFSSNLVGQKFGKLTVLEMLESNHLKKRKCRCICDCGSEVMVVASSLTSGHTLSCGCLVSYHNMYIKQYLESLSINFTPEYSVKIDGKYFRFDFYLHDYNTFIEYDGQQHFEEMRYYGTNSEKNHEILLKTQKHDAIKNRYCEQNGIPLLRIPYWESKNIETVINSHLHRLSEKGIVSTA